MTSHLGASGCGGPVAPIEFAILSTLFLLREVEAASSMISAWHLHREAMELTWHLPASMSDHMALWTRRTWGCLCGMPSFACPFHVAAAHNGLHGLPDGLWLGVKRCGAQWNSSGVMVFRIVPIPVAFLAELAMF